MLRKRLVRKNKPSRLTITHKLWILGIALAVCFELIACGSGGNGPATVADTGFSSEMANEVVGSKKLDKFKDAEFPAPVYQLDPEYSSETTILSSFEQLSTDDQTLMSKWVLNSGKGSIIFDGTLSKTVVNPDTGAKRVISQPYAISVFTFKYKDNTKTHPYFYFISKGDLGDIHFGGYTRLQDISDFQRQRMEQASNFNVFSKEYNRKSLKLRKFSFQSQVFDLSDAPYLPRDKAYDGETKPYAIEVLITMSDSQVKDVDSEIVPAQSRVIIRDCGSFETVDHFQCFSEASDIKVSNSIKRRKP